MMLSLFDRFFRINKGYGDINELQLIIMRLVDAYVRDKNKPIPHKFIMVEIAKQNGIAENTIKASIRVLVHKGYIRKAIVTSNKTFYVMLRTVKTE